MRSSAYKVQGMSNSPNSVFISGANRGIGLEFARYYLELGAAVVATCRNPAQAADLHRLTSESSKNLTIESLDLALESSIRELTNRLDSMGLKFDLVVSNAGVCDQEGFGQWTKDSLETNLSVNTVGPALLAQALVPWMKDKAKLVHLSSGMGSIELNVNQAAPMDGYAISKAGLNMLTRRLANHLAARRIPVVALSPGWVRTDMGGEEAPMSATDAVKIMADTIDRIELRETGLLLEYDGTVLPW